MPSGIVLKPVDRVLFIGDSITDADRLLPSYSPYGFGYAHFAAYRLLASYPDFKLDILNTGISGNTIRDLSSRWESDCIDLKPDILSVLIGVNDI